MAVTYDGSTYYYASNLQGDIVAILDASGSTVVAYTYDAWGKLLTTTGSMASTLGAKNPLRYRGYVYDTETGLYYLQSRYYDPEMGRFINADDLGFIGADGSLLSYNIFAYCFNNPVQLRDSEGNWPTWAKKLAIGAAVVVGVAAVAAITVATGGTGTMLACAALGAAKGAAIGFVTGAVSGAASGAITHIAKTGSTQGVGNAMLNGMADGAMTGAISGAVTGAFTSPYCFIAGTAVLTAAGAVAIETIKVGDLVWAWDEETGEVALKEVVETYINETDELVHVFVNGEEIVTTPSHPFYSPVKGWIDAIHLRAGDILVLVNGEYVVIEKVQHEILEAPVTVYNFQVEDLHTYYVASGILVHNTCGRSGKQARLRELANDDKLSSALRGEIKRDINAIARGQRTTIRVPQGYQLSHRIGYSARQGYSYAYSDLNTIAGHKLHHKIFGYK